MTNQVQRKYDGGLTSTDENFQDSESDDEDEDIQRHRDVDEESKDDIDPSDQSAIDSFAQTQYSKFYSNMGHSRFTHRGDRTDLSIKRSPMMIKRH